MRKKPAILFGLLLATLISMSTINLVQAAVSSYNWIGPTYRGYDSFYGATVVAYETGSEATLVVSVYNDWWTGGPVNVSAVKVGFDWGMNYSSIECSEASPVQIQWHQSRVLTVAFTVPGTTVASNLVTHMYTIYVEHVNSTTGPKRIVGTWMALGSPPFAVYSADQAEARALREELDAWRDAYEPLFMPSEARELWVKATVERYMANDAYDYGNFADAKTHYDNALNFTQEAILSEVDKTSDFEDALLELIDSAGIYLSMQGWGFIVLGVGFGIGFLLVGIGAVVYLVRKSGTPAKAKSKA